MRRLDITIPDELSLALEKIPNKSRFIAEAVKEKLEQIKKQQLEELLVKGYKVTAKEDIFLNKEWEQVTLENW